MAKKAGKQDNYVLTLLRQAQPTDKEIQGFIQLAKSDLGQDFSLLGLKSYKLIPYGSSVNGLFTNGSDLDLFVRLDHPVDKEEATRMVRSLAEIMKTRKRGKSVCYTNVVTMTNGRIPVLKCSHVGMDREININFTSHTGVNNTYLIKHLITLDSRIRPMMLLLKIYFKLKLGPSLTTFNLYSLIIFALQNAKDPVLPPLSTFLDASPNVPLFEKRWPVQFQLKPFATKNKQTLMQLILHFCSFYADFDFTTRIVSPYMGNRKLVTKENFIEFDEFVCADHQFKTNRLINVQDFFVLCVNLGTDCKEFQGICKTHHENRREYAGIQDEMDLGRAFFKRELGGKADPSVKPPIRTGNFRIYSPGKAD